MAAKKKNSSQPKPPVDITKIKGVAASKKPAGSAVGGKQYKTPKNAQPAYSGPKVTAAKTPVKTAGKGFAGSGTPLGTSLAGSKLSKGNVAKTATTAIGVGSAIKAGTGYKVVRGVAASAKGIQRKLSKSLKEESTKKMTKTQRQAKYEADSELVPGERASDYHADLRKEISEIMKSKKGPLKIVKRR